VVLLPEEEQFGTVDFKPLPAINEFPSHTLAGVVIGFATDEVTVIVVAALLSLEQLFTTQTALYDLVAVGATVMLLPVSPPVQA
jgi:hypothetical protein